MNDASLVDCSSIDYTDAARSSECEQVRDNAVACDDDASAGRTQSASNAYICMCVRIIHSQFTLRAAIICYILQPKQHINNICFLPHSNRVRKF